MWPTLFATLSSRQAIQRHLCRRCHRLRRGGRRRECLRVILVSILRPRHRAVVAFLWPSPRQTIQRKLRHRCDCLCPSRRLRECLRAVVRLRRSGRRKCHRAIVANMWPSPQQALQRQLFCRCHLLRRVGRRRDSHRAIVSVLVGVVALWRRCRRYLAVTVAILLPSMALFSRWNSPSSGRPRRDSPLQDAGVARCTIGRGKVFFLFTSALRLLKF